MPGPVPPALRPVRRHRARPEVGAREPERDQPADGRGRPPGAAARARRPVRRQRHRAGHPPAGARRAPGWRRRRSPTPTSTPTARRPGWRWSTATTRTTSSRRRCSTSPIPAAASPASGPSASLTSNDDDIIIPPETVPWPNSGALNLTGDYVWVRFVHDADAQEITTWTSTNGTTFTQFGAAISVDAVPQPARRPEGRPVRQARRLRATTRWRRRLQRRGRHRRPADARRRLRRRRRMPAERRVRGHRARRQVGGRQPGPGRPRGRRRQPDADHRPGRRLRRQLHGPEHPPAGGAGGPVDGDDEARPHGDHGQRPGRGAGDLRPAEPEPLRQGDAPVQDRRRSGHAGQPARQVDRADADHQRQPRRQLRRQLPQQRGAHAADQRPVDPRDATTARTSSPRTRTTGRRSRTLAPPVPATAYGANGVTKIGVFVKHDGAGPADPGQVRLLHGRRRELRGGRGHHAAADHARARPGGAGR